MEKRVENLILTIQELKKRLNKKEEELAIIQRNCQHSLSEKFEIEVSSKIGNEGRFQFEKRVFRTCQKCGKKILINN